MTRMPSPKRHSLLSVSLVILTILLASCARKTNVLDVNGTIYSGNGTFKLRALEVKAKTILLLNRIARLSENGTDAQKAMLCSSGGIPEETARDILLALEREPTTKTWTRDLLKEHLASLVTTLQQSDVEVTATPIEAKNGLSSAAVSRTPGDKKLYIWLGDISPGAFVHEAAHRTAIRGSIYLDDEASIESHPVGLTFVRWATCVDDMAFRIGEPGALDGTTVTTGLPTSARTFEAYPGSIFPNPVLTLPDGKLVLTGNYVDAAGKNAVYVERRLPDGAFDPSFGAMTNGKRSGRFEQAIALGTLSGVVHLPLENGKARLLVCGMAQPQGATVSYARILALNDNGELDTTWDAAGTGQMNYTSFSTNHTAFRRLVVTPSGEIFALGVIDTPYFYARIFIVKLEANGALNAQFGVKIIGDSGYDGTFFALGRKDGSIAVLGRKTLPPADGFNIQLFILESDGSVRFTKPVPTRNALFAREGLIELGDDLLVMVRVVDGLQSYGVLRRYGGSTPKTDFGQDGIVTITFGNGTNLPDSVRIQNDGKIVVAGIHTVSSNMSHYAFARFSATGTSDPTFGKAGTYLLPDVTNATTGLGFVLNAESDFVVSGVLSTSDARFAPSLLTVRNWQ